MSRRPSHASHQRVLLGLGFLGLAFSFALLYALDVVLPGSAAAAVWVTASVVCVLVFRFSGVHLLALSSVCLAFYLYIAVALLWPVIFPQIFIAVHSTSFQTPEIFAKANHLAAVGLCALLGGWLLGFEAVASRPPRPRAVLPVGPRSFLGIIGLGLPMLVLAFPTESIFTVGYNGAANQNTVGAALGINVIKPGAIICALLALVSLLQRPSRVRWAVWGAFTLVLVVVLGFASGDRVEEVGCIIATGWIVLSARKDRRTPLLWAVVAAGLCLFLLVLGEVRSVLPAQGLRASSVAAALGQSLQLVPTPDTGRMRPSTNGDAALTFCVVIGLVDTGVLRIDYGETFLRYLDMTLPRFMNVDRPVELEVLLQRLSLTGGGLYILAEPYVAGGAFGIFVVLWFFGAMMGALERFYSSGALGPFAYFLYALLLSCVPRWFQYSILSMYKHVLTGLLILAAVKVWEAVALSRGLVRGPVRGVGWQT